MMHFARNIKLIRELSGLTQVEFATVLGTNKSNIKTYETTEVEAKGLIRRRLAKLAGVPVHYLSEKELTEKDIRLAITKEKYEKYRGKVESFDQLLDSQEPPRETEIVSNNDNAGETITDQLIRTMIQVMERQNEILKENREAVIDKVNQISLTVESLKVNQDKLINKIDANSSDLSGKFEAIEKTVVEKFAALQQFVQDEGNKVYLHEFGEKGKSRRPVVAGKKNKVD
jgi:transcriptional regulator with XRE-family HTH domain